MTVDPVARGTELEPRVQAEVQRVALSELLNLLFTVLTPRPIGILLLGHSRPHVIATLLIALSAWGMACTGAPITPSLPRPGISCYAVGP